MKTKTSVSLSSDARSLLTAASEDIGVSKSAVLEIAIREYAYQRSVTEYAPPTTGDPHPNGDQPHAALHDDDAEPRRRAKRGHTRGLRRKATPSTKHV